MDKSRPAPHHDHTAMPIDRKLLEILCCPVTKHGLRLLRADEIDTINEHILSGNVTNYGNEPVTLPLTEGLITDNRQRIYRIDDSIPVMLEKEGLPVDQFDLGAA